MKLNLRTEHSSVNAEMRFDLVNRIGLDGLSAYEIAVAEGFDGSVEQWLDDLRSPAREAASELRGQYSEMAAEANQKLEASLRENQTAVEEAVSECTDSMNKAVRNAGAAVDKIVADVGSKFDNFARNAQGTIEASVAVANVASDKATTEAANAKAAAKKADESAVAANDACGMALAGYFMALEVTGQIDDAVNGAITIAEEAKAYGQEVKAELTGQLGGKVSLDAANKYTDPVHNDPVLGLMNGVDTTYGYATTRDAAFNFTGDRTVELLFTTGPRLTRVAYVYSQKWYSTASIHVRVSTDILMLLAGNLQHTIDVEPSTTYHVVITRTGDTAAFVVNGSCVASGNVGEYIEAQNLTIGRRDPDTENVAGNTFQGIVHGVRLFAFGKTVGEMQALWNDGRPFEGSYSTCCNNALLEGCVAEFLPSGMNGIQWRNSAGEADLEVLYDVYAVPNKANIPEVVAGQGAPDLRPLFTGQTYIDTVAREVYVACGCGSSDEWVRIS